MSPTYVVCLRPTLMTLVARARTAVSPLGRRWASWREIRDRMQPHRRKLGVRGVDVGLAQGVAGQIDLPKRVRGPGDDRRAAHQEDRAARHDAHGKAGQRVGHRVVIPHDVAHQVRRQCIDGTGLGSGPRVENEVLSQVSPGGRPLLYCEAGESQVRRQGSGLERQRGGGCPIVQDMSHDVRRVGQHPRHQEVGALTRHERQLGGRSSRAGRIPVV